MVRVVYRGYPVRVYKCVAEYPSVCSAAEALGVSHEAIRDAVEKGRPCKGVHVRYADMPEDCQPIRPAKKRREPIVWEGQEYGSIMDAAGGDRAKWMRIWRALGGRRRRSLPDHP
jgi:hypothetical protein